mgnify:CR=1 FL=1
MPMASAAMEMRPPSSTFRLCDEALVQFADEAARCRGGSFEDDFAGGAGAQAELVFLLAAAESGRVLFDGEGRDAVLRGGAIGDRHGHAEVGVVSVGGERLGRR